MPTLLPVGEQLWTSDPVKGGIGRRGARLEGLSSSWARAPGIVIASARIRADTERAHSERSLRLRGQVQAPRRYPAVGRLIPTGGRLAPAPPGFVPGGGVGQKAKTPSEGGRISNCRETLHRLCPSAAGAVCRDQRGLWRTLLAPGRIRLSSFQVRCRYGRC